MPETTTRALAQARAERPISWAARLLRFAPPDGGKTPTVMGCAMALLTYTDMTDPHKPIWPMNQSLDSSMGLSPKSRGKSAEASLRKLREWGFVTLVNPQEYQDDYPALKGLDRRKHVYLLTTPKI